MQERETLESKGWRVRETAEVAGTPWDYQRYIQGSFAEFSCAKPSCVRLQGAWISDRTLCYLASGRPAAVQFTGASALLPENGGLLRFASLDAAVAALRAIKKDYEFHAQRARELAERVVNVRSVAQQVLEWAL